jgi:predicted alpha/beta hydrolase
VKLPHEATSRSPVVVELPVNTTDGLHLSGTLYTPAGPKLGGSVLVLPGIGFPRRAYRHLATYLSSHDYAVLTFDYRGMWGSGGSEGLSSASLGRWARADAIGAFHELKSLAPRAPLSILAHSFGGQILGLEPEFRDARAAATIGTSFGQPHNFDGRMKAFTWASWNLTLPFFSSFMRKTPGWLGTGEPLPAGVAREWARWGRGSDWCLSEAPSARQNFARFDAPLLALRATDDEIAPVRAERSFLRSFSRVSPRTYQVTPQELRRSKIGHGGLLKEWSLPVVGPLLLDHFAQRSTTLHPVRL